jgi:hypothetical protein
MPCWISIFKRIIPHINIQIQTIKAVTLNSDYIGRYDWRDTGEYNRMLKAGSFKGSSLVLVGASHTLTDIRVERNENKKAFPAFKYLSANSSIAVTPKSIIDESSDFFLFFGYAG